ncbi:MAG: chromosomal replication initiator protein DnaA [Porphyromonas sp.]|nr:chromosomal replication initiator protein DnaA [Porphyromonas sp.]
MDSSLSSSWDVFLSEMNAHLSNSREFNIWFKPLEPVSMRDNTLTIRVPSQDYRFKLEGDYFDLFKGALEKAFGTGINLIYSVPTAGVRPIEKNDVKSDHFVTHLDERMGFDTFYQSICNRLAYTAAKSIVAKPGETAFNPLFVYGASGVGKTHLMHAVGNELVANRPGYKAVYVPAQTFKRQFVDATITTRKPEVFFNYYQNIDLLLIDDIQELSEAISTQNAFFQIFNHLKMLGKQIIITSDRCPADLKGMEDRLYTRLKWGLTVEIERPDAHLRREILSAKVNKEGVQISDEVFNFIVKHAKDNVRDLEGALTSLMANALYCNEEISMDLARKVLSQTVGVEERKISVPEILDTVCKYYNIDAADVIGRKRKRDIVQARQVVMYLAKELTDVSLAAIGADLGGRDHSTVIYADKTIRNLLDTDQKFGQELLEIRELLDL